MAEPVFRKTVLGVLICNGIAMISIVYVMIKYLNGWIWMILTAEICALICIGFVVKAAWEMTVQIDVGTGKCMQLFQCVGERLDLMESKSNLVRNKKKQWLYKRTIKGMRSIGIPLGFGNYVTFLRATRDSKVIPVHILTDCTINVLLTF
jgi:hypothetical protein